MSRWRLVYGPGYLSRNALACGPVVQKVLSQCDRISGDTNVLHDRMPQYGFRVYVSLSHFREHLGKNFRNG